MEHISINMKSIIMARLASSYWMSFQYCAKSCWSSALLSINPQPYFRVQIGTCSVWHKRMEHININMKGTNVVQHEWNAAEHSGMQDTKALKCGANCQHMWWDSANKYHKIVHA